MRRFSFGVPGRSTISRCALPSKRDVRNAIRYVDANQDRPFYLFLSFLEPHHQNHLDDYPAPEGYRERYTGRWIPPDLAAKVQAAIKDK